MEIIAFRNVNLIYKQIKYTLYSFCLYQYLILNNHVYFFQKIVKYKKNCFYKKHFSLDCQKLETPRVGI